MTKKIEAIIREEKLNDVKEALSEVGIVGMTVTRVRGRGRGSGLKLQWRSGIYTVDLIPKVLVSIVLSDDNVEATIEAIIKGGRTGNGEKGDGMIFVMPVEDVIRISTGERGREAITYQGDIDTRKARK